MRTHTLVPLLAVALGLSACATPPPTPADTPEPPADTQPAPAEEALTEATPKPEATPALPERPEPEESPEEILVITLKREMEGKYQDAIDGYEALCPYIDLACTMMAYTLSFAPEPHTDLPRANATSPLFLDVNSAHKGVKCKRTPALINARFEALGPHIRFCYERALLLDEGLSGELYFDLIFNPDGRVSHFSSNKEKDTLSSRALDECAEKLLSTIDICKGGSMAVQYPYIFQTETKTVIKRRKQ